MRKYNDPNYLLDYGGQSDYINTPKMSTKKSILKELAEKDIFEEL